MTTSMNDHRLPEKLTALETKLRQRVYKGIPNAVRGEVWARLLNVPQIKIELEGKYEEMVEQARLNSTDIRQIDLDVNKTFRNNIIFHKRQQSLFQILTAYSIYNAEVGYCQGMSQIAGLLLMFMNDEDTFWALSVLMTDRKHAMHVLRLWDAYMLDGEIILIAMSYTLLKLHQRTLLKMDMKELIEFLQIKLEQDFGYNDDVAIEALQTSIFDLQKNRLHTPGEALPHELPQRPVGLILNPNSRVVLNGNRSFRRTSKPEQEHNYSSLPRLTSEISNNHSLVSELSSPSLASVGFPLNRNISLYSNVDLEECYQAALKQSPLSSRMDSPNSVFILSENSLKINDLPIKNDTFID